MFCRNLLKYQCVPKLLPSHTCRTYYPDNYDRKLQNSLCDFKITPPVGRLDYPQQENEYIHKLLSSDKLYVNSIAFLDYLRAPDENCPSVDQILGENYEDKTPYVLLCYLKLILKSSEKDPKLVENPKVVDLCTVLSSRLPDLRDEHLWNLMKVLTLWPNNEESDSFFNLCKSIDEEAVRRHSGWSYDQVLLTMDHFYRLRTLRYSEFVFNAMKRLWRNPGKLSAQQVVHAMFLVNANRKWHPSVDVLDVESVLMFYIYELTVEEVGVLALAFFKTRARVKNMNLVQMMYDKLGNRVDDVHEFTLTSYLKFFRLCTDHALEHSMKKLLDKLTNRIDELPIPCCLHIALLGSRQLVFHRPTLQKVCEKIYDNIESVRLKELERLAFVLQLFNFTPDNRSDILKRIAESLHNREEEIDAKPKSFLSLLHYLSLGQCYDYDLIAKGLSTLFLKKTYGSLNQFSVPLNVVHLNVAVQLECPDYKGSCLSEKLVDSFCKKSCHIPDSCKKTLHQSWVDTFSIRNVVCRILGSGDYVHLMYLLPYAARADVFFCMKDNQPLEIPANISGLVYTLPQPLPNIDGTWYAVVLLTKWNIVKDTGQLVGSLSSKIRHLQLLGCKTILVNEDEYQQADKIEYMKKKIYEHNA